MKTNTKKYKSYIVIALITLIVIVVGFTAAYFQAQVGAGANANVTVTTKTTDVLTFAAGNDITINATQANFYSGAGNRTGSTTATAYLRANNDTESATGTYNVYFNITGNSLHYTTQAETAEFLLTITDPTGTPVTSLTGLTYTTVKGVSGFDITEEKGLIQIASDYTITSNSSATPVNQTWNFTVTLINLDSDQQANTGKRFTAQAIIQKEEITTAMMDTGENVNDILSDLNDGYGYYATSIKRATQLPENFTATADNTISTTNSENPIYVWYAEDIEGVYAYYGDINADKSVNSDDLSAMDACIAGNTCTEAQVKVGDLDQDGDIDSDDRSILNDYVSNTRRASIFYAYSALLPETLSGVSPFISSYGKAGFGTIYFYSDADIIYLNQDSSYLFYYFEYLNDIDDLAYLNTSYVTEMYDMFCYCYSLTNINPLANWDVSNVTLMEDMFYDCYGLTIINGLSNWDVSNVIWMDYIFYCCNLMTLTPISNWNISSVTNMGGMFSDCSITTLTPISHWDVSSVTNMSYMFSGCTGLTTLTPISNWDVSSVTNMSSMFSGCTGLTTLTPISNWNISSVTNMGYMFSGCTGLTTLTGLENWNVSSVTNMGNMFSGCTGLTDASAINDWNITSVNTKAYNGFAGMFKNCSVHPTFSKRAGTWNNGTFIASA